MYGDSLKNSLVAIAFAEKEVVEKWAKEKGVDTADYNELLKNSDLRKAVLEEMEVKAKEA